MKPNETDLPEFFKNHYRDLPDFYPVQKKAINSGLLENKSLLICAPTASGKTLIATMAITNILGSGKISSNGKILSGGKAIYVVPLKALANEKYREYCSLLENTPHKVIMSTGDVDSDSPYLSNYDLVVLTSEKLDSLIRHRVSWLAEIKTVIIDEVHLLNDPSRGPTLEIIISLLKSIIKPQIIALSATIGNPEELAEWLGAELIVDDWRPVKLKKGIHHEGEIEFYD